MHNEKNGRKLKRLLERKRTDCIRLVNIGDVSGAEINHVNFPDHNVRHADVYDVDDSNPNETSREKTSVNSHGPDSDADINHANIADYEISVPDVVNIEDIRPKEMSTENISANQDQPDTNKSDKVESPPLKEDECPNKIDPECNYDNQRASKLEEDVDVEQDIKFDLLTHNKV